MSVPSIAFAGDAAAPVLASASMSTILSGLHRRPKELPSIYFYDERGSELFERICALPEYYLTRTETDILARCTGEISALLGPDVLLVEIGSGSSVKTSLVLDHMERPAGYVPVDVSRRHLEAAVDRLRRRYPELAVVPRCVDFTAPLSKPIAPAARTAIFFPGSTIGNFEQDAAVQLLAQLREFAGRNGALIIGTDLVKDVARLVHAYNDSAGVTAEFNLNMLANLNRQFGSDFNPAAFEHDAPWVEAERRIEMHLVSRWPQQVHIGGETIHFSGGERLRTEICHKYTLAGFAELAKRSGWEIQSVWADPDALFSIQYAQASRWD
jgi:dimethylhistidine N-methyltransferase